MKLDLTFSASQHSSLGTYCEISTTCNNALLLLSATFGFCLAAFSQVNSCPSKNFWDLLVRDLYRPDALPATQ